MYIDPHDMRFFGPNWKILIPLFLILMLPFCYVVSLFVPFGFWSVYFFSIIVFPIIDVAQRAFSFMLTGK